MFELSNWLKENTNLEDTSKKKKKKLLRAIKKYKKEHGIDKLDKKVWNDLSRYLTDLNYDYASEEDRRIMIIYWMYNFASKGGFLMFFRTLYKRYNIDNNELLTLFDNLPIDLGKSSISALKMYSNEENDNNFLVHDKILKLRKDDLKNYLQVYLVDNFDKVYRY